MNLKDKKVLVCGMARSGIAAAGLLKKLNADVTIQDLKTEDSFEDVINVLKVQGINLYLGANPDDIIDKMDMIVLSPGVPTDLPFVIKARELGIAVIGEIELAYMVCKAPIIALTGTNGKTTTTTLVGEILKEFINDTYVVGNIGYPFADIALNAVEDSVVVAELSSFQLETVVNFKPKVSAVLNITPDHLNRHHTLENYVEAKENIFKCQDENDYCILNCRDRFTLKMADKTKANIVLFSLNKEIPKGIYSDKTSIYINDFGYSQKVIDIDELKIIGDHNVENAMAAIGITLAFGVPLDIIVSTLKRFVAVEHRIEFVKNIKGIDFYNDSKGTNPDAAIKAIEAMKGPICLIAGGYDKNSDFLPFVESFKDRVKFVAIIGNVKKVLATTFDEAGFNNYKLATTLTEAVDLCYENAEEGNCVLLSPACASWDMFDSYEQRGDIFKDYVNRLN